VNALLIAPCLFRCTRAPGNIAKGLILARQFTLAMAHDYTLSGPTAASRNDASTVLILLRNWSSWARTAYRERVPCRSHTRAHLPLFFDPAVETRPLKRTVVDGFIMCCSQSCSLSASASPLVQSAMSSANSRSRTSTVAALVAELESLQG
jgi:hypothetical protein